MGALAHLHAVAHHLRLFGLLASVDDPPSESTSGMITVRPGSSGPTQLQSSGVRVVVQPCERARAELGLDRVVMDSSASRILHFYGVDEVWSQPRTLHDTHRYASGRSDDVVATIDDRPCWLWRRGDGDDVLVVGSNLGADLVRYRQGNRANAARRPTSALWGIRGERPNYLFDGQLVPGREWDRSADWWAVALARTVAERLETTLPPLLPGNAPGAVVVTGDDDQAYLEKYDEQLALLEDVPVTYFLHPLTRHTRETLTDISRRHRVEFGLHPDALDQPNRYGVLFSEQAHWFRALTGAAAELVRNHGFLNDGYWGHLPVWLEHGIRCNANLPGVNGAVINGSLLPTRMAWQGDLTPHWSILTAIGDGVRFALGMDGPQSAQCIRDLAARVETSGVPGVIVLNLHPQNVSETREMHMAVHELVGRGFVTMTLGECIDWFAARDGLGIED